MFEIYEVGKKYPTALGHQEGMYFDIDVTLLIQTKFFQLQTHRGYSRTGQLIRKKFYIFQKKLDVGCTLCYYSIRK